MRQSVVKHVAHGADLLFDILGDYPAYPAWMPGVAASRVLVTEGDVAVVEVVTPRQRSAPLVLEAIKIPPRELRFQQIDQYRRAGLRGTCRFAPAEGGDGNDVELTVTLGRRGLGWAARRALRRQLAATLEALAGRSSELTERPAPVAGRHRLLEVTRQSGRLEVWYRGQRYRGRPPTVGDR